MKFEITDKSLERPKNTNLIPAIETVSVIGFFPEADVKRIFLTLTSKLEKL